VEKPAEGYAQIFWHVANRWGCIENNRTGLPGPAWKSPAHSPDGAFWVAQGERIREPWEPDISEFIHLA